MDSLNRDILRLSLPAIASNVTVPLLGLCDTAISGHLGSELFLASIAVGTVMLNVVFWMFGFLRGGTTGLTANALGASDYKEVGKVLCRGLFIALIAGVALIAAQRPLFAFLSLVAGQGSDIDSYVRQYFNLRIWGSPALLATMAISGWFVGMQSTLYPMIIAIAMNVVNIAVSFLLVFPCGMGFPGVAAGTLISNWTGLAIALACLWFFKRGLPVRFVFSGVFHGGLWRYFSVNGNLFLRSFFIICVTMGVTAAGARLGTLVLAVNVIVMQFFQFFSFFMDGFAFSGEAIIGLRAGQGDLEMLGKSFRRLLQWTLGVGLCFTVLYFTAGGKVAALLTDSPEVVGMIGDVRLFIGLIPIVSCWAFIYDGFYIGLTDTWQMMISTLLGGVAFFMLAFTNIAAPGGHMAFGVVSNEMIWTGFLAYLFVRGAWLALMFRRAI